MYEVNEDINKFEYFAIVISMDLDDNIWIVDLQRKEDIKN